MRLPGVEVCETSLWLLVAPFVVVSNSTVLFRALFIVFAGKFVEGRHILAVTFHDL